ncbi:glycoside hydrolase family protein [Flavicella sediminum]|uniref:glycoside hydrolase family protein n=1 Tax=Flavicella sediminum TaxID=2585141 RepID=UPI00111CAA07|nr:glycoside hydrolase family protein [Flavicella sediminum]
MKFYPLLVFFLSLSFISRAQQEQNNETDYANLTFSPLTPETVKSFQSNTKTKQILVEPGYYVWGLSVVKWNGKYHAYYSRWDKKQEHKGWMTHCEIAHGISDNPAGPFTFVNVVLKAEKMGGWDINNSHNPYALVAEGKIVLYYIANDIKPLLDKKDSYPTNEWFEENRVLIRESQCIGVATANNPSGPFKRAEKVVVKPDNKKFRKIAVNPATIYHNGTYLMIMKGDDLIHKDPFRIQLVGNSENPEGPFDFYEKPVYKQAQTEDACLWFDQVIGKYFMVCHVMGKSELAMFSSKNGFDWQPAKRNIFMKKEFILSDGTLWKPKRVERPFVLTNDKGQPIVLYVAVYDQDVNGNIAIPINYTENN